MARFVILFANRIDELVFARENSPKTVRFASTLPAFANLVQKFHDEPLLVSEKCLSPACIEFTKDKSLLYSVYKNLDELKDLLLHGDEQKVMPLTIPNEDILCQQSPTYASIVGSSPAIQKLKADIVKIAAFDVSVLLLGETGTGKSTVARAIHELSPRRDKNFKNEVLSNMNETLVESKLFGVTAGAFTGAIPGKGLFEETDKGTLFLDEIGEISPNVQTKLLKVLGEGLVSRIGSNKEISVDNRMIFATNANLEQKIRLGTFREDLFYRINDVTIKIPPLRDRLTDLPELCEEFLRRNKIAKKISPSAIQVMQTLNWKGNVRQLEKCIQKAALIYSEGDTIEPKDIIV